MSDVRLCESCGMDGLAVAVQSACVPGTLNGLCACCWEAGAEPLGRLERHISAFRDTGDRELFRKAMEVRSRTVEHLVLVHGLRAPGGPETDG